MEKCNYCGNTPADIIGYANRIAKLHKENKALEKQLADIKYLSRDEVINILYYKVTYAGIDRKTCLTKYEFKAIELNEAIDAICNLAIPDIKQKRKKIIKILHEFVKYQIEADNLINNEAVEYVADEIIAALEGK